MIMPKMWYVWRICECEGSSMCVFKGTYDQCKEWVSHRSDTGRASYVIEGE